MKRNLVIATLVAVLFATLNAGPIPAARAWGSGGCSNAGVAGSFGYSYTGTLILPTGVVPAAAVGRYASDAAGNLNGSQTRTVGGGVAQETITGKLSVNADCSATLLAKVYQGGVFQRSAVIALQYDDNASQARGIFESLILSNGTNVPVVITIEGKRLFHGE